MILRYKSLEHIHLYLCSSTLLSLVFLSWIFAELERSGYADHVEKAMLGIDLLERPADRSQSFILLYLRFVLYPPFRYRIVSDLTTELAYFLVAR